MREFDAFLKKDAPFKRYESFAAAGISYADFEIHPSDEVEIQALIRKYQEKFTRMLLPSFRQNSRVRSDEGQFINAEEAMEGIEDCFRQNKPRKRAPLRVGINLSRAASARELVTLRGGAILALAHLCKSRGQQVVYEAAYGNGLTFKEKCHLRVSMPQPNLGNLTRICCAHEVCETVGRKLVEPLGGRWIGGYRFYEFEAAGFPKEYDFVLDRIETHSPQVEEQRIVAQFKKFRLM